MSQVNVGFIGLGLMGAAMVGRLQDKGYPVTVVANRSREAVDAAIARGATEVSTAREVAANSDIVMLCMDTSASVESRMRGDDGVIAGLQAGATVIDFGTSLPSSTRELAKEVAAAGGQYLDGPLGRTPAHAKDGLLNIMAAGDEAAFNKIKPVLQDLGENVFHLGASGSGHTIKLMNNFLGVTTANAVSEIFVMADLAGIPRDVVYEVMAAGPLHSGMMGFVKGYAVDGDAAQLAFAIKNAAKDIGYYDSMVKDSGSESAIAPAVICAMTDAISQGRGDAMLSEMVDYYAGRAAANDD
uniref:3-hydroxyisobutyrate dehydrogenase (EC) n=1 Tax=uncultured Thiotrichaceae bacterium TaxID=298394 RepID=A0A6S6TJ17_9GAMM|nr:MAG: 3-hydroxyisobutyrate dehydrogenase (EC [uncultured Thiotrichaceae bacterium]